MTAPEDPFRTPPPAGTPPPGQVPPPAWGAAPPGHPPPAQQPWGTPGYAGGAAPRNGLGVAALVLGLLAVLTGFFVLGGVLGVVAVVLGVLGRGRAKRGEATNGGVALAGIVLGLVGIALTAAVIAIGASFLGSDSGQRLVDCLEQAGADPEAQQQCQRELEDSLFS